MEASPTIAAIATAPGRGGVAIVRVSGPDAHLIATKLSSRKPKIGQVVFATFSEPITGTRIDSGLLLTFKAPHSYTGEDVVEFQCHGGMISPQRILNACITSGARLASRGEFTQRAFLNARLTLDQAQAVLDLIDARTYRAADVALETLDGNARTKNAVLRELYDDALSLAGNVEHALDISEEELPPEFTTDLCARIDALKNKISNEMRSLREKKILRQGALVILAGSPNAGKSSLMNALLGENRVIVADVPGTTRDSIEEWLDIKGWPVRLVDTAGLRETEDLIEAEGVKRTKKLLEQADVVIKVTDSTTGKNEKTEEKNEICVFSKCDLLTAQRHKDAFYVSVKTGEGISELRDLIAERLTKLSEDIASSLDDEKDNVLSLYTEVFAILSDVATNDLVLCGNSLRRVCARLAHALGAEVSSDLLETIFSRFCVGK